jgi:hypothetical protein
MQGTNARNFLILGMEPQHGDCSPPFVANTTNQFTISKAGVCIQMKRNNLDKAGNRGFDASKYLEKLKR